MIVLPARGTPERAALVRSMAESMWLGRDDRPFSEIGEYWTSTFEVLAEDALRGLERYHEAPDRTPG